MFLKVEDVTKKYGGLTAVDNVSFEICEGETVGLIGPNGAGKSTLISTICGIYKPDKGKIYFQGEDITGKPPHDICKKGISITFQLSALYPELTAERGVALNALYGSNSKMSLDDAIDEAHYYLEKVGFPKSKNRSLIGKLNTTEQKKVKLAMGLVKRPKLIILDEIFTGLGEIEKKEFSRILNRYKEEENASILLIEHIMKVIMSNSNRIVVMDRGKKIAEGTPREVANNSDVISAYLGEGYKFK